MLLRRLAVSLVVCWGSFFSVAAVYAEPEPGPHHHAGHNAILPNADAQKPEHAQDFAARKARHEAERARREHLRELAEKNGDGHLTDLQRDEVRQAVLKDLLKDAGQSANGPLGPHEIAERHEKWIEQHREEVHDRREAIERLLGMLDKQSNPSGGTGSPTAGGSTSGGLTVSGVSGLTSSGPGSNGSGTNGSGSNDPGSNGPAAGGSASGNSNGTAQGGTPNVSPEQEAQMRREYHWLLEHFDTNGNGRLDPDELAHAREAFHRHVEKEKHHLAEENSGAEQHQHAAASSHAWAGNGITSTTK